MLEALLAAVAGLVGGFISALASNSSAVTLPALELMGLPDNVANGTNRLSVVALGLVGVASFYRRSLVDWRKGSWIAALVAVVSVFMLTGFFYPSHTCRTRVTRGGLQTPSARARGSGQQKNRHVHEKAGRLLRRPGNPCQYQSL